MAKPAKVTPFAFSDDDPLAHEHALVAAWVEDAIGSLSEHGFHQEVDRKTFASGQKLLDGTPEQSRRYALAAVEQARHWDSMADEVRSQATTDFQRSNAHLLPGWGAVWGRRRQAGAVLSALMRRALPFGEQDLIKILHWCNRAEHLSPVFLPIGPIAR